MILDATAGNRSMWRIKNVEDIIYIDIEKRLEVKPTIFCDNTCTPFKDRQFDTILFDPPHTYGVKGDYHSVPHRSKEYFEKWGDRAIPRYYGWDRYLTKAALIRMIYDAQKEFNRILKDDGLLWLKWNDMRIHFNDIITVFIDWLMLLKIYVSAPSQTRGKHQTYWIALHKKERVSEQLGL